MVTNLWAGMGAARCSLLDVPANVLAHRLARPSGSAHRRAQVAWLAVAIVLAESARRRTEW